MGRQVDARLKWGRSSVGRAPALQAGGQEFESLYLHQPDLAKFCKAKFMAGRPSEFPKSTKCDWLEIYGANRMDNQSVC